MAENYREPGTGRYAYWNDFERLCVCGHTLGQHVAGGFECLCGPNGIIEHHAETRCECQKFRPSRKKPRPTEEAGGNSDTVKDGA